MGYDLYRGRGLKTKTHYGVCNCINGRHNTISYDTYESKAEARQSLKRNKKNSPHAHLIKLTDCVTVVERVS